VKIKALLQFLLSTSTVMSAYQIHSWASCHQSAFGGIAKAIVKQRNQLHMTPSSETSSSHAHSLPWQLLILRAVMFSIVAGSRHAMQSRSVFGLFS